jgi:hypothetical protein
MSKTAKVIQAILAVALVAAAIWFYLNLRDRRITLVEAPRKEVALDPDYYVVPKKLHPQDARRLSGSRKHRAYPAAKTMSRKMSLT